MDCHSTPINKLFLDDFENNIYIKRDDLIPFSFGGNKARKAFNFFSKIDDSYDAVVTYGSSSSNHCRIVSNLAYSRGLDCYIIGPEEASKKTFNRNFMELFGAEIIVVPVEEVHETIENKLEELKSKGKKAYFIPGGGHGNLGTKAYVDCYDEIKKFEGKKEVYFDYIFFATGTGTTQSGLVCGQIINNDSRKIIGISIARKNPRGRDIVIESIKDYFEEIEFKYDDKCIQDNTIFIDEYTGSGYGKQNDDIRSIIIEIMCKYGIPLDSTYTGKAFAGMKTFIKKNNIKNKNILFIHTGGTPLFFDDINDINKER